MKYILYQTTNLVNNCIYIGVHKTETPERFDGYLGNGIYINKPNTYEKSKTLLQQAVKEFGVKNFKRSTIGIFNTYLEAWKAECLIINDLFLERTDVYNIIKGSSKRDFLSINDPLYKYDKEGKYEGKVYPTLSDNEACIVGYLVEDSYHVSTIKAPSYDKAHKLQIMSRPVYKYNSEGKFIQGYQTQELAEKENKYSNIAKSIRLKSLDKNGFYWSLEKLEYFNKPLIKKPRKVAQIDENGNIIKTWESINSCAKEMGGAVKNVFRGKYEEHKGFKYKYID